ncbi:MAG: acyl-CoA desaturase [Gemmataceae bacterium]|nr:acyl-CoA desaturase [Gemmataceae bacterium]
MQSSNLEAPPASRSPDRLIFTQSNGFRMELQHRVDAFLESTGRRPRDCWQMYLKSAILFATYGAAYVLLVFFAQNAWQAVPLAVLLGLATAGIGFNVQHDAGHNAYSNHPWINRMMAITLDLIGGSSFVWRFKHGIFHHTYVNVTGHDTDIDVGILARLSPHEKRYAFHRWQHIYLWALYGLLAIQWHLQSDFYEVLKGRIGKMRIPRPRGWDLVVFLGGKAFFFCMAFAIPLCLHSVGIVLLYYAITAITIGITLSVVFQLAHTVEEADFPMPAPDSGRISNEWAVHQVETTVDFARNSRIASWCLGGLNFQIEHHLFPRICHIHYPAIAPIVESTCREYGVRYVAHPTFCAGVASHYRWLRKLSKA